VTALIVITGCVVLGSGLFTLWCLLSMSSRADEQAHHEEDAAWDDLVSLQALAAERGAIA
jgi:hypothetical protein